LQYDELFQIVIIESIGLAHAAPRIELVKPDIPCRRALFKEQHHGLDPRTLKGALRAIEDGGAVIPAGIQPIG